MQSLWEQMIVNLCSTAYEILHIYLRICMMSRGVVTGQVFRYLPDHFFSKLPEQLPIQMGGICWPCWQIESHLTSTACAWLFRSCYGRDHHASRPHFYLQDESETFSEGLKIQYFPGEACPLRMRTFLLPHPFKLPDHSKFRGYGPDVL